MQTCDILGAVAPYAARIITHLFVVSSRQRSYGRRRCDELFLGDKLEMNSTQNDKIVYADEWNVSSQYFYKNEYYNWMADNITGHKKVLEIGCGTGYSTLALLEKGFDVIAIEKNEECIRKAEQRVLTTNGQASFESVMDIVFVSILLNN